MTRIERIGRRTFVAAVVCGIAAVFISLLSGCASPEKLAAANDAKCQSYGAKPGTDGYLQCRLALDKMASDQRAALLASPDRSPTTCVKSGNVTNCY